MHAVEIEPGQAARGLMALVVALVEVLHEAMCHQAVQRLEAGHLSPDEVERVGIALQELEEAVAELKHTHGLDEPVADSHQQLRDLVHALLGGAATQAEQLA